MVKRESVDEWWLKIVPPDSLRTKIITHIAQNGPSSPYDIAREFYTPASRGYPTVFRNLKQLEAEKIVKRGKTRESAKGGKKNLYALTEFIGIPCAWAYCGDRLDFPRLLTTHEQVFKTSKGLDAYKVIWEELGARFCVETARKAFLAIIEGLDDEQQLFNILLGYMLDGKSIKKEKIAVIAKRNDLVELVLHEARNELDQIIKFIEKSKK